MASIMSSILSEVVCISVNDLTDKYKCRNIFADIAWCNKIFQGSVLLKQYLECAEKAVDELQVAHSQLEDDSCAKREAASVDSAIVRFRRRNIPNMFVQSASP